VMNTLSGVLSQTLEPMAQSVMVIDRGLKRAGEAFGTPVLHRSRKGQSRVAFRLLTFILLIFAVADRLSAAGAWGVVGGALAILVTVGIGTWAVRPSMWRRQ